MNAKNSLFLTALIAVLALGFSACGETSSNFLKDVPDATFSETAIKGDKVVKDESNKLMWVNGKKACYIHFADRENAGNMKKMDFSKTFKGTPQEAVNHCKNLRFAGYSDWRLPNVQELRSIVKAAKEKKVDLVYINPKCQRMVSSEDLGVLTENSKMPGKTVEEVKAAAGVRCVRNY